MAAPIPTPLSPFSAYASTSILHFCRSCAILFQCVPNSCLISSSHFLLGLPFLLLFSLGTQFINFPPHFSPLSYTTCIAYFIFSFLIVYHGPCPCDFPQSFITNFSFPSYTRYFPFHVPLWCPYFTFLSFHHCPCLCLIHDCRNCCSL